MLRMRSDLSEANSVMLELRVEEEARERDRGRVPGGGGNEALSFRLTLLVGARGNGEVRETDAC